jgi:hypothetical protein
MQVFSDMKNNSFVELAEWITNEAESGSNSAYAQQWLKEETLTTGLLRCIKADANPFDDVGRAAAWFTELGLSSPFSRFEGTTRCDLVGGDIAIRASTKRGGMLIRAKGRVTQLRGIESKFGS